MKWLVECAILLLLVQSSVPADDDEGKIYEFRFKDGSALCGRLIKGDWSRGSFTIELDEPWLAHNKKVTKKAAELEGLPVLETPGQRDDRHKKGWEGAGYQSVETPSGKQWVLAREVDLAHRARDLAMRLEAPKEEQPPELRLEPIPGGPVHLENPLAAPPEVSTGHPVIRLLAAAATGLAALAGIAMILKKMVLA